MNRLTHLEQLADAMGITISHHAGGEKGKWIPETKTVSIRHGMHPTQTLCTLAHELGHAHHGHTPGASGWLRDRQEREADEWAAGVLIDDDAYMVAESDCGGYEGAVAWELGVTVHLLRVWRRAFQGS